MEVQREFTGLSAGPVRDWFASAFPKGPTPAQRLAWPEVARGENVLLVSPTGSGKTLAAFLAILDRLHEEHGAGTLAPGLRCVYISPLRSLGYDVERNLLGPLEAIRARLSIKTSPVSVAVRSGDTSAYERRKQRDAPPHLLITTPESLSLLLSQPAWQPHWERVERVIVDEVHALAPTKRGADLAISLERLSACAKRDPARLGLSATCRPPEPVARFLCGPSRICRIIDAPPPEGSPPIEIDVASLIREDEAPERGLTYRRLIHRLRRALARNRTTVIFANTRAFTERLTHDLRRSLDKVENDLEAVAAHHSALDAKRRRAVESSLKDGTLRAVVTSTSLELGVDIGSADLTVQVGLPGGVSRLLQRVGRSGHRVGVASRGLILAATPAELAGAVVTAHEARAGRIEPLAVIVTPLDVLCQQLIGMACEHEWRCDDAFELVRKSEPMYSLTRADFDACLAFLAGDLAAPTGADEPEPGSHLRWTSPRIWRRNGLFGVRSTRVARWFRSNVGTITSEESVKVLAGGVEIGTLEGAYAERLQAGDRFVLDGRSLEFQRLDGRVARAKDSGGAPSLPRWSSDRQGLSKELAAALGAFREEAARRLAEGGEAGLLKGRSERGWSEVVAARDGLSAGEGDPFPPLANGGLGGGSGVPWTQELSTRMPGRMIAPGPPPLTPLSQGGEICAPKSGIACSLSTAAFSTLQSETLGPWLCRAYALAPSAAAVLVALFEAQERCSEVPAAGVLLIEESPRDDGWSYSFHAPLSRSACEALGRAIAARVGGRLGRDVSLTIADLGWALHLHGDARLSEDELPALFDLDRFDEDVLEGLDRGDLLARRFRHVACTALMVLRNPEGGRRRVGGMHWVSNRLYPLVKAACPDHPLLRETRREVLQDLLDAPAALAWLASRPQIRLRRLNAPSPFALAWIEPGQSEAVAFETAADALKRLHARLIGAQVAS